MAEKRRGGEIQGGKQKKGGQKVTGLSTLPVDRDAPGLRGGRRAAAAVGQGRGGLEEVAERQVMTVIAAGPGVSSALVAALLRS